jgi:hypothetical protein
MEIMEIMQNMRRLSLLFIPILAACSKTDNVLTMTAGDNTITLACANLVAVDFAADTYNMNYAAIVFNDNEEEKIKAFSRENMRQEAVLSYQGQVIFSARIYSELGKQFNIHQIDPAEFLAKKNSLNACLSMH